MQNNYPGDCRANFSHPEHLDYCAAIIATNLDCTSNIANDAYIAPGVFIAGAVSLGARSSIWPGASLRGDCATIHIGDESNVQDNAVIHVGIDQETMIGRRVTIGHGAIIHGCKIGDECLVGMGAIIMDGAIIGERCLIGAHATILMNTVIAPGSMVVGSPGKIVRQLSSDEQKKLGVWADHYLIASREYHKRGIMHEKCR